MKNLLELRDALRLFASEREWEAFHSPKNLAMALGAEAGELLEPFLWLSEAESRDLPAETLQAVKEELADVLIYLVRLADTLDVDLLEAAQAKVRANETKYPVAKARGNARKYTQLESEDDPE